MSSISFYYFTFGNWHIEYNYIHLQFTKFFHGGRSDTEKYIQIFGNRITNVVIGEKLVSVTWKQSGSPKNSLRLWYL